MNVCEITLAVLTSPQVKNRYNKIRSMKDAMMSSLEVQVVVSQSTMVAGSLSLYDVII
jgi:hypothetical protein